MKLRFVLLIFSIIWCGSIMATPNKIKNDTIPFLRNQACTPVQGHSTDGLGYANWGASLVSIDEVKTSEFKDFLISVRQTICSGIKKGSVKVWISVDASGKILSLGASAQSGVEVSFQCD